MPHISRFGSPAAGIARAVALRLAFAGACFGSTGMALAVADPTPQPTAAPKLPLPSDVLNNPYVQGVLNALGGITQTTTGANAFGKVTYFKQFDLQLQTAPTVYRKIRLHPGTVINPRGTTLANGMTVQISGNPQADGSLNADTITVR